MEQRRRARASWPIQRRRLDEMGSTDVLTGFSPSELVAMVNQLTQDAWAMAGAELPDYPRALAPGRVTRRRT